MWGAEVCRCGGNTDLGVGPSEQLHLVTLKGPIGKPQSLDS